MNFLDRVIMAVNPQAGLKRMRHRAAATVLQSQMRDYDAAKKGGRNAGWRRNGSKAADEVSKAAEALAATAQELVRNTPFGNRIKKIWASNMVGTGIRAELMLSGGKSVKRGQQEANADWNTWADSPNCDYEGNFNLYGLQWLIAATMVETGGAIVRFHVSADKDLAMPLKIQVMEQTRLDKAVTTPHTSGNKVADGIEFNAEGVEVGCWVLKDDDTTSVYLEKYRDYWRVYSKERAGQHLGVSWFAAIATTLRKYDVLMDAKLMQDQIAACLGIIIEDADQKLGVTSSEDDQIDELEPGMVQYVAAGSKVHTVIPPSSQGSQAFMENIRNDIAIGVGLAGTQLTGDYSKLNFASGRMSKIEFFMTLDHYQYGILKPLMDVIAERYKTLYALKKSNRFSNLRFDWTMPPRGVVQPKEELETAIMKVRNGLESPSGAAKAYGKNLETVVEQWSKDKEVFGPLSFDIDPSKFSAAGNQLNVDDAASSNNSTDSSTTSGTDQNGDSQP